MSVAVKERRIPKEGHHRQRLLEGAIACLEEKGYARTTARDLVAASGTNLGSIGYHFGSKEELLDEALGLALERWFDPLIELGRARDGATLLERLERALREFLASLERNRPIVVALYEGLAQAERSVELRERMAASYERSREAIAAIIREQRGDQVARQSIDPEAVASMVIAIIDGLMMQWYVDPERLATTDELIGSAISILPLVLWGR